MCDCCMECEDFVKVGHKVPTFALEAYFKGKMEKVSLEDYKGKWVVLFFYPLDFTFVCPTELIELSKRAAEFSKLNTQILGVSVDSVYSHQAWCKEIGDLAFPMLSDLNKDLSATFDVLHDGGMALRGTFVIDDKQVLRAVIIHDLPLGRNVDELKRVIEAAQSGELCPVGWTKGKKTLGNA